VKHLLVFGPGYSAKPIMTRAQNANWQVTASYRNLERQNELMDMGFTTISANAGQMKSVIPVTHILVSISPPEGGDVILKQWESWLKQQKYLQSLHYLSSTNVYGNHDGAWVDETTQTKPSLARGKRRLDAEQGWQNLAETIGFPAFIYRLAGIYGPGRNAFQSLKAGKARRIIKSGQIFGRIHVADIEAAVWDLMNRTQSGGVFNLADDLPTPPQTVIEEAARLLNISAPKEEAFEDAELSVMARSFYAENKRVKNDKIKAVLGRELIYPTYKEGLKSLLKEIK